MKNNRNLILTIVAILLALFFWWFGYDIELKRITQCTAEVKKHVVAEFSEITLETSIDMDGNISTSQELDSWDEPASDVYTIYTINGKVDSNLFFEIVGGIGVPKYPSITVDYSRAQHFDRYSKKHHSTYEVLLDDGDYFTDPISIHKSCMKNLGRVTSIKTWYGIKYSSNFGS